MLANEHRVEQCEKADYDRDDFALLHRKFPGMTRDEILHVLDICKDEATLEYERSQEVLASMQETTAGYAALFALLDLWRSQSKELGPQPQLSDPRYK